MYFRVVPPKSTPMTAPSGPEKRNSSSTSHEEGPVGLTTCVAHNDKPGLFDSQVKH